MLLLTYERWVSLFGHYLVFVTEIKPSRIVVEGFCFAFIVHETIAR